MPETDTRALAAFPAGTLAALLGLLFLTFIPAAEAELRTAVVRQGPITVGGYQVRYTSPATRAVQAPDLDGFIVRMHARVVDESGAPIPVNRLMLHHILYKTFGRFVGERRDWACGGPAESFYGSGEEDATLRFPPGYGYRINRGDQWTTSWMLMNHQSAPDSAYIEYEVTVDDNPSLTHVTPYWLRVTGCPGPGRIDPIFDVPGGGRPGSTFTKSAAFRLPEAGRLIAAGGHAHGGAKALTLSQPGCDDRPLMASRPLFGRPDHPYYNVLPVLHEPGPVDMSWVQTRTGIPIGRGETLRLTSAYDGELPHTRVMGIMHLYVAHDPATGGGCSALPTDLTNERLAYPGRERAPEITVPLVGIGPSGRAHPISKPPGRRRRLDTDPTVMVRNRGFLPANLSVPPGALVRWRFRDVSPHNVTLASGPFGFSSYNRSNGGFKQRLRRPGVYRLFCSLHPTYMSQTIVVRRQPAREAR